MSDADLLSAAIEASGLPARRFAVELLGVNERTVRRWLAGDSEIRDEEVRDWLTRYVALHETAPARLSG